MSTAISPIPRSWQVVWLAGFALLLGAPAIGWLVRVPPPAAMQEMRALAPWPESAKIPLTDRPAKFEAWLRDHYPLRGQIVRAHSVVWHQWLRAPSASVIVGRDAWLFFSGDRTLEDLTGNDPLTPAELDQWATVIEGRRAWLRSRGIAHLFVVVPNKSTIYPEQLPADLRARVRPGKLDQLFARLQARGSGAGVLDLRQPLLNLKERERAYWITDSHWSAHGLVAGTEAILRRLGELGVHAGASDWHGALNIETVPRFGDCTDLLALRGLWPSPPEAQLRWTRPADLRYAASPLATAPPWKDVPSWRKPVVTERDSAHGRAVLLCDSFFRSGGMPPEAEGEILFQLCFRRFTSLWEWTTAEHILAIAEHERPDVIIEAWTERFLKIVPADHPEFARARAAAAKP